MVDIVPPSQLLHTPEDSIVSNLEIVEDIKKEKQLV